MRLKRTGQVLATQIEWMKTPAQNAKGLLKFDRPPQSYAAIFVLSLFGLFPVVHTFGMRFSIDLALCDKAGRVIFLERDVGPSRLVVPWRFLCGGCRYLVEFSKADIQDLRVGDELVWEAA